MIENIEAITGDFSVFQDTYFNKKPMLRQGALPTVADEVLSIADMDELINLEMVRFPYIKVNLNGSGVPEPGYTKDIVVQGMTQTGVVDPAKVHALYRAGATITWASVNQIFPKVRQFVRMINDQMAVRTDAVAFLTPANKKGYPAHHDGVDLFIIQLSGSKHWRLWDLAEDRRSESANYTEESLGTPAIEVSLKAGDVLYLPYGTPHQAAAEGEPSLHLSVMMRPRMWRDLIKETVDRILAEDEFLEYPALFAETGDTQVQFAAFMERVAEVDQEQEWDRYRTTGKAMPGVSQSTVFQESAAIGRIDERTALRRAAISYGSTQLDDGRVQLEFTGLKFAVSSSLAHKLGSVGPGHATTAADLLAEAPVERQRQIAKQLVRMGLFVAA